jgi:hypothetical protein
MKEQDPDLLVSGTVSYWYQNATDIQYRTVQTLVDTDGQKFYNCY